MQVAPAIDQPAAAPLAAAKPSLAGVDRAGLAAALEKIGVAPGDLRMRVGQLWHWIYFRGAQDFAAMTSVSKALRTTLAEHYTLARPEVVVEQVSTDGTRKWLLRLPPETPGDKPQEIETVYIPESDRGTLCISSQIGCTLTCTFCHTGTQRLVRNLTAAEIVGQVMVARDRIGEWPDAQRVEDKNLPTGEGRMISNIVFMGMGEPLYNFDGVKSAIETIADGEGISIGKRRITDRKSVV